jgi:hypothetical protein
LKGYLKIRNWKISFSKDEQNYMQQEGEEKQTNRKKGTESALAAGSEVMKVCDFRL